MQFEFDMFQLIHGMDNMKDYVCLGAQKVYI